MKLAAIMPVAAIDLLESNYHFCFAELALQYRRYADYYREAAKTGTVIMDTMVFERKRPMPMNDWLTAIELVCPTVVVAMDVLEDAEATKKNYRHLKQFVNCQLMPVTQGATYSQFLECFSYFVGQSDWIALPVQVPARRHERFHLLELLRGLDLPSDLKIHLLGASSNTLEREHEVRDLPFIQGMDTTKPIAIALNHYILPHCPPEASDRAPYFFDTPRRECTDEWASMRHNVEYMRGRICSDTV